MTPRRINPELHRAVTTMGNDFDSVADGFRNVVRVAAREIDKAERRAEQAEAMADSEVERRKQAEKELSEYEDGSTTVCKDCGKKEGATA
jgi:rubrerythrin